MSSRFPMFIVTIIAAFTMQFASLPASAKSKGDSCKSLKLLDPDNDGSITLGEAKKAASDLFDKLNHDNDGTVDIKELQGRLSRKDFAAGDPDKDKTLTKDEYLAIVEQRFKAANGDADDTVDCKELGTAAGKSLVRLLK